MNPITCIEDLRRLAQKKVPKMFFDYADSGSYSEHTYRRNMLDFDDIYLRQRVAVNVEARSTQSRILGCAASMPVAIAPTGLAGMQWANGEILGAQVAEQFGVPFTLSTMSICSIEDVARATQKPFWFQLYVMRDRGFVRELIQRARAARCSALMLTLDLQILGQRHQDIKNGLTVPPQIHLHNMLDFLRKPAWAWRALRAQKTFGNLAGYVHGKGDIVSLSEWTASQFDASLCWDDIAWIKREWGGKLILKGVLDVEDARLACAAGADAIVVSNHGGRQLDGTISSIRALPRIVDAIGDQTEVWLDGGIRCGQSILKAQACGAKACLIGRPFLYGLGAMGAEGVRLALEILQRELDVSMALTGINDLSQVGRDNLVS